MLAKRRYPIYLSHDIMFIAQDPLNIGCYIAHEGEAMRTKTIRNKIEIKFRENESNKPKIITQMRLTWWF